VRLHELGRSLDPGVKGGHVDVRKETETRVRSTGPIHAGLGNQGNDSECRGRDQLIARTFFSSTWDLASRQGSFRAYNDKG